MRREKQPVQVVFSLDGGAVAQDCSCPICADLASRGIPTMTLGSNGEMVEVTRSEPPEMIEISVRGSVATTPELSTARRTISVPVGCVVQDAVEFLRYKDHGLQCAFPPGGLTAEIGGTVCEDSRVLFQGDELQVFGKRSRTWAQLAKTFEPLPDELS